MKVGLVGLGIVGGALKNYFDKRKEFLKVEFSYNDPNLGYSDDYKDCDFVFVSVPIPSRYNDLDGPQDLTIVRSVLDHCSKSTVVVIRSTILPGTCLRLSNEYDMQVIPMPEFLTERTADECMEKLPIIFGSTLPGITNSIKTLFKDKDIKFMEKTEAEMVKYVHNCFGAVKINFFNVVYEAVEKLSERIKPSQLDFETIVDGAVNVTNYMSPTYTLVPGPDGQRGFGGKCFPKDLRAFTDFLHSLGVQSDSFKGTEQDNHLFRKTNKER